MRLRSGSARGNRTCQGAAAAEATLTESFEAAMFAIVDHRLNYNLPVIATLNDTGATLSARMTGDRGEAFIARLREMSDTIHFK